VATKLKVTAILVVLLVVRHGLVDHVQLSSFGKEVLSVLDLRLERALTLEEQTLRYLTIGTNSLELHYALVLLPQGLEHFHHPTHRANLISQKIRLYIYGVNG